MTELLEVTPRFYVTAIYSCETQCEPVPCKEEWKPCMKTKTIQTEDKRGGCTRIIKEKVICYEKREKKRPKKKCPTPTSCSSSSSSEEECTETCTSFSVSSSEEETCTTQTESCSSAWLSICEEDSGVKKPCIRKPKY